MVIELRKFFEGDDIRLDIDYEFNSEDELFSSSVKVKGYIKNSSGIVSLDVMSHVTITDDCAKCAKKVKNEMSVPSKHILVTHLNDEDNDEFIVCEDMTLNLDELICEDIYLAMPMRVLCKEDCKGLCPYCGVDLNETTCSCKKPIDPRLSALAQLLD